eukprot:CAMPEP_0183713710 /NCGR_PEP_ID=MMETSP0737-20130205/8476_1 /TAXON_ID=385413 /ORGANISM="Thalassiosira miniscula, Strain CCMP1093" /LENGTH=39 /DNA_ID= /DNA_START= /DNA_END= /DNA_ORIENTATION=
MDFIWGSCVGLYVGVDIVWTLPVDQDSGVDSGMGSGVGF